MINKLPPFSYNDEIDPVKIKCIECSSLVDCCKCKLSYIRKLWIRYSELKKEVMELLEKRDEKINKNDILMKIKKDIDGLNKDISDC